MDPSDADLETNEWEIRGKRLDIMQAALESIANGCTGSDVTHVCFRRWPNLKSRWCASCVAEQALTNAQNVA